jgi:ABC-type transporter Mla subunit MlaD
MPCRKRQAKCEVPMAKERNAFKAGLFMVISIVLMIAVIVGIKGVGQLLEPDQIRAAEFTLGDDVGGLRLGDDVRIGGMKVGIVRSIRVEQRGEKAADSRVVVQFNIPKRLSLRDGAHIAVQSTLTGTAWLNFDSLGEGKALADNAVLTGAPSAYTVLANSITDLTPEIQKLASDIRTITLPKVNKTVDNAGDTFASAKSKIDGIIAQYNKVVDRTAEVMVNIRDIFGDSKVDIRKLMANAAGASGTLKDKLPVVLDDFDKLLKKVNTELDSTTGVLA